MKTKGISWTVTGEDEDLIEEIAARAVKLARELGFIYAKPDALMDLTACHANGAPLRLAELLKADKGNFGHDVFGIRRHLNHETGQLGGFFSPRYAVRKGAK